MASFFSKVLWNEGLAFFGKKMKKSCWTAEWFLLLRGQINGLAILLIGSTSNQLRVAMGKVGLVCGATAVGLAGMKFPVIFFMMKKWLAICVYEYYTANAIDTFHSQGFIFVSYKLWLWRDEYPYHRLGEFDKESWRVKKRSLRVTQSRDVDIGD